MSRQLRQCDDSLGASLAAHAAFHDQTLVVSQEVAEWLTADDAHRAFAFHMVGDPNAVHSDHDSPMAGSFNGFTYSSHRDRAGNCFWLVTDTRHAVTAFLTSDELQHLMG